MSTARCHTCWNLAQWCTCPGAERVDPIEPPEYEPSSPLYLVNLDTGEEQPLDVDPEAFEADFRSRFGDGTWDELQRRRAER